MTSHDPHAPSSTAHAHTPSHTPSHSPSHSLAHAHPPPHQAAFPSVHQPRPETLPVPVSDAPDLFALFAPDPDKRSLPPAATQPLLQHILPLKKKPSPLQTKPRLMSDESPEWFESFASWIDDLEVVDPHIRSFDVAAGLLGDYAYAAKSAVDLPDNLLSAPLPPANVVAHPQSLSHNQLHHQSLNSFNGYNDDSSDTFSDAGLFTISRKQSWAAATSPTSSFGYNPSSMSSSIHHQQPHHHHQYHQYGHYNNSNGPFVPLVDSTVASYPGLSYSAVLGGVAQNPQQQQQQQNRQQPTTANPAGIDFEFPPPPPPPQFVNTNGIPPLLRTFSSPHSTGSHSSNNIGVLSPVSLSAANNGISPTMNYNPGSATATMPPFSPDAMVSCSAPAVPLVTPNMNNSNAYSHQAVRPLVQSHGIIPAVVMKGMHKSGRDPVKPGDWLCPAAGCGFHNFARRTSCVACGLSDRGAVRF
ncbi:hypothetical protein HDU84_008903 [Entophlyctis sp. JEL0112]|nr:hypothetical protein HDU84_008903 [Entophlyctis sp. JEL0112]